MDHRRPELIERLGRDHVRMTATLNGLAGAADALVTEAGPDWARVHDLLDFLRYYADRVHHPLEDRLMDRLLHKGLTPGERHLVFRNLGQHQEIHDRTERIAGVVEHALRGEVIAEEDFSLELDAYLALQRRHMRFEETHLFPLLCALLGESDWTGLTAVEAAKPNGAGSISGNDP